MSAAAAAATFAFVGDRHCPFLEDFRQLALHLLDLMQYFCKIWLHIIICVSAITLIPVQVCSCFSSLAVGALSLQYCTRGVPGPIGYMGVEILV